MIKRILPSVATLFLGGCVAPGTPAVDTGTSAVTTITQIQGVAVQICGFLPDASVVANIIATAATPAIGPGGVIGVAIGEQLAAALCKIAIDNKASMMAAQYRMMAAPRKAGAAPPSVTAPAPLVVKGQPIPISGTFVGPGS